MKFLSLDLETTGLDPDYCQILEVGAVIGDLTDTPVEKLLHFHCLVHHDRIVGEPYALAMNRDLLSIIAQMPKDSPYHYATTGELILPARRVWGYLRTFIDKHFDSKVTLAGKNVMGFDMPFVRKLPDFDRGLFHHRAFDPGSMYWEATDTELPSTVICLKRAGIEPTVTHRALDDCRDVVRLVRGYWQ